MDWFATWFNSPYYHLLYRHRNDDEAHFFIDNLLTALHPPTHARALDLACGKGRHSRYIAQQTKWQVVGVDLAPQSIQYAQQFATNRLHFAIHDMRQPFAVAEFDYVFNFFTSFGYFNTDAQHYQTVAAIGTALKAGGYAVIDFFNAHKVIAGLVAHEEQTIEGIRFDIRRSVIGQHIVKKISVTTPTAEQYHFEERVQAITLENFVDYFTQNGFSIHQVWGNYALRPFNLNTSDRLIIVAQKNA